MKQKPASHPAAADLHLQAVLSASEERYRSLVEASQDVIFIINRQGTIEYINHSGAAKLGVKPDEIIGRKQKNMFPAAIAERQQRNLGNVFESGEPFYQEGPTTFPDGERWLGTWLVPLKDDAGQVTSVMGVSRDITERVQAEEALRESEARWRFISEATVDGIVIHDQGRIVDVSDTGARIVGYTREELIGQSILIFVHPDSIETVLEKIRSGTETHLEAIGLRKDGTTFPCEIQGRNLIFQDNPVRVVVVRDLTGRKQAEEMLRRSQQETDHANSLLRALSQAAQAVQRALSTEEVYRAIQDQVTQLGYFATGFELAEDGQSLVIAYISYRAGLVRKAEKMTGFSLRSFHFRPRVDSIYERVIVKGETVFVNKSAQAVADALPKKLGPLARPLAELFKLDQSLFTPLKLGEETVGLLAITGPDLTEADGPAVTVFARQAAIAIQNARLYEQAKQEIAERRQAEYELQKRRDELEFINKLNDAVNHGAKLDNLIDILDSETRRIFSASACTVYMLSPDGKILSIERNTIPPTIQRKIEQLIGKPIPKIHIPIREGGYIQKLLKNKKGTITSDPKLIQQWILEFAESTFLPPETRKLIRKLVPQIYRILDYASIITVPLTMEDKAIGLLEIAGKSMFTEDHLQRVHSISGQLTAAILRKQTEIALAASEAELRALFASMHDVVLVIDREGVYRKIASTNPALLYRPAEELIGQSLKDVFPADKAGKFQKVIRKVLKTGQTEQIEYELIISDRPTWFSAFITPLTADSTVWVARDITERKNAEEEIRRFNAELEQRVEERTCELRDAQEKLVRNEKLAVLGQMAGGVGHELRNPLGVINSAVYYLKLIQPDADDKVRKYHNIIEDELHTAVKIINDLLTFASLKSSDQEPVSIPDLVQRVLLRFPVPWPVEVVLKLPPSLPKIFADLRQMEQVLGNLVVNAYQAMPDGGELSIPTRQEERMVVISVADTGEGIPPENLARIFEPLFTTKAKGIGLGLAVCANLVEANGGRIEVQSESGQGATFTIYLPIYEEGK
jgi:PAS domain S-box-containing protein